MPKSTVPLVLLGLVLGGCSSVPRAPLRVRVTDAETGAPLAGVFVQATSLTGDENADEAFDEVAIEHRLHQDNFEFAGNWLATATTSRDGFAKLSGPIGSGGMAAEAYRQHYFSADGLSDRSRITVSADHFTPSATQPATCELSLLSGDFKGAKIVLVAPADYRGPILVRQSDHVVSHQPGQTIFKFPVNIGGVTDLPMSPPRLMSPNIINLTVTRPDGTALPPERVPFFYRGHTPTLQPDTIALRAVDFGITHEPRVAAYFIGTLADTQKFAKDHGIGDWHAHLAETAVRKLFEPR